MERGAAKEVLLAALVANGGQPYLIWSAKLTSPYSGLIWHSAGFHEWCGQAQLRQAISSCHKQWA